jgi:RNA polymerase sigma factor (sigma-70 family)
MLRMASPSVVPRMESLFNGGCVAGLSDRQLIERFATRRDSTGEAAFAALVARHGPMVLSVCQQLLGDRHSAEDAFQAVFLVLARRARSIRDPELLGNWLYGVALRTARKAKVRLAGRKNFENEMLASRPAGSSVVAAFDPVVAQEQAEALHDEIGRLPAALRLPVVLCYFEGLTIEQAARRLRWPHGTVRSRLARARDKLRRGLERRGGVLPAGALAATLKPRPTSAPLSCQLCDMTARVATQFAAGRAAGGSACATALGREMLKSMLLVKLKLLVIGFLVLGAVATGAGFVGQAPDRQAGKPDLRHGTAKGDDAKLKPGPGRMVVVGRVLTPTGSPAPNAIVMIYASLKWAGRGDGLIEMSPFAVGQAASLVISSGSHKRCLARWPYSLYGRD